MVKKAINIAVMHPSGPTWHVEALEKVKLISPRIKLTDISEAIRKENNDNIRNPLIDSVLSETEIFFGSHSPKDLIARAPRLKWIQSPLAGVDFILKPDVVNGTVIVTNSRFHGTQIRELVFNLMLMLARQSYDHFKNQEQKKWQTLVPTLLYKKTIGI